MDETLENQALENEIENGGQGEVVDTQENPVDAGQGNAVDSPEDVEEADPLGEQEGYAGGTGPRPREPERKAPVFPAGNTRLENAAAKAARIRAEQETTQRLQQQFDEQVAGLGVPNPYTGKPFRSFAEFQEYGKKYQREQMKAEAKQRGTTVEALEEEQENRAFLARKRQEEQAQKAAAAETKKHNEFVKQDLSTFMEAYPNVDVAKLETNTKFLKFVGDRLYRLPLKELYGDFVEFVGETERSALERTALKQGRSTGGAQSGGADLLTPAQRRELDEWNQSNPEMKMTPKEFLEN